MAKINLLPWRDRLREKRKKEFIQTCGLILILAAFVIIAWGVAISLQIEQQTTRNERLKSEITKLEKEIEEVESLQKKRNLLVDRMKVIQNLQAQRPLIVHIFDDLVRTLPEEVYYTSITRAGNRLRIDGVAESNDGVSALMRKLDSSAWFLPPVLSDVTNSKTKSKDGITRNSSAFKLEVIEEGGVPAPAPVSPAKGAAK